MPQNLISQTMTNEQRDAMVADLDSFDTKFAPFQVNLTPEDIKKLLKLSAEDIALLDMALTFAQQNPGALPADVDVTEFGKDIGAAKQVTVVDAKAQQTATKTRATRTASLSDAMTTALAIYRVTKAQGRTPQNATFLDAFGQRFAKTPHVVAPTPPTP